MYFIILVFFAYDFVAADHSIDPYVVNGNLTNIKDLPHLAILMIDCDGQHICGGNILNEKLLVSAAHCMDSCTGRSFDILAKVGSSNMYKGKSFKVTRYVRNAAYAPDYLGDDIAILMVRGKFTFNKNVKRVAIMANPPKTSTAISGGWGTVNEITNEMEDTLKKINQKVWTREQCRKYIKRLPEGAICGGELKSKHFMSAGDSGGGLIVKKYILIGLVSFKEPSISRSLVIYTDVAFFYDWIKKTVKKIIKKC